MAGPLPAGGATPPSGSRTARSKPTCAARCWRAKPSRLCLLTPSNTVLTLWLAATPESSRLLLSASSTISGWSTSTHGEGVWLAVLVVAGDRLHVRPTAWMAAS